MFLFLHWSLRMFRAWWRQQLDEASYVPYLAGSPNAATSRQTSPTGLNTLSSTISHFRQPKTFASWSRRHRSQIGGTACWEDRATFGCAGQTFRWNPASSLPVSILRPPPAFRPRPRLHSGGDEYSWREMSPTFLFSSWDTRLYWKVDQTLHRPPKNQLILWALRYV